MGRLPGAGPGADGVRVHGVGFLSSLAHGVGGQEVQEVGRLRVWDAYLALVQALTGAELVELPPGAGYRHCSSAVLLAGSLATSAQHCSLAPGAGHPGGAQRERFPPATRTRPVKVCGQPRGGVTCWDASGPQVMKGSQLRVCPEMLTGACSEGACCLPACPAVDGGFNMRACVLGTGVLPEPGGAGLDALTLFLICLPGRRAPR